MRTASACRRPVLCADQQIPLPVARNRSVFRLCGSFPDRDGMDDLPPGLSVFAGMARSTHAPLRPQVVHQLFFQYSLCLNEQAAVNSVRPAPQRRLFLHTLDHYYRCLQTPFATEGA